MPCHCTYIKQKPSLSKLKCVYMLSYVPLHFCKASRKSLKKLSGIFWGCLRGWNSAPFPIESRWLFSKFQKKNSQWQAYQLETTHGKKKRTYDPWAKWPGFQPTRLDAKWYRLTLLVPYRCKYRQTFIPINWCRIIFSCRNTSLFTVTPITNIGGETVCGQSIQSG